MQPQTEICRPLESVAVSQCQLSQSEIDKTTLITMPVSPQTEQLTPTSSAVVPIDPQSQLNSTKSIDITILDPF